MVVVTEMGSQYCYYVNHGYLKWKYAMQEITCVDYFFIGGVDDVPCVLWRYRWCVLFIFLVDLFCVLFYFGLFFEIGLTFFCSISHLLCIYLYCCLFCFSI